jgi:carbon starvation protein CstA
MHNNAPSVRDLGKTLAGLLLRILQALVRHLFGVGIVGVIVLVLLAAMVARPLSTSADVVIIMTAIAVVMMLAMLGALAKAVKQHEKSVAIIGLVISIVMIAAAYGMAAAIVVFRQGR